MKRRVPWAEWLVIGSLLLVVISHALYGHVIPCYLTKIIQQVGGSTRVVKQARLDFPFRIVLSDVNLTEAHPGAIVSSHEIILVPQWLSWRKKTVWFSTVKIKEPRIELRRARDGKVDVAGWSTPSSSSTDSPATGMPPAAPLLSVPPFASWHTMIHTLEVVDGTVAFIDEKPAKPFHGTLTGLTFAGGPIGLPRGEGGPLSLAVRGQLVGYNAHAAAVYCSGWIDLDDKNLDVSCQLEPLRLAAFEPYYQAPLQARAYDATVKATSRLTAKSNELDGRVQLEISNLSDADLSSLGKTLADLKKIAGSSERTLTGEIQISGPLDQPGDWRIQLVPGNDIVQRLIKPLLDRGIEIVQIKVGQQTIHVGLAPATEADMSTIQETSKTVEESLKLLAPTSPLAGPPSPSSSTPSLSATQPSGPTSSASAPPESPPETKQGAEVLPPEPASTQPQ